MLQAGRSPVRIPMMDFSIDQILPAALWHQPLTESVPGIFLCAKGRPGARLTSRNPVGLHCIVQRCVVG
jgi:hypothetical protein